MIHLESNYKETGGKSIFQSSPVANSDGSLFTSEYKTWQKIHQRVCLWTAKRRGGNDGLWCTEVDSSTSSDPACLNPGTGPTCGRPSRRAHVCLGLSEVMCVAVCMLQLPGRGGEEKIQHNRTPRQSFEALKCVLLRPSVTVLKY